MIGPEFFREGDEAEAELRAEVTQLQAEIERLRCLLRDYVRAAEDPRVSHDDFQDGLKAWEKRVREALEEQC